MDTFNLDNTAVALRNKFVEEYLKDFDEYSACIRMGYNQVAAIQHGKFFMGDNYVLCKLMERRRTPPETETEQETADRQLVLDTLREAASKGSYHVRVMAVAKLAEILQMTKPQSKDQDIPQGGVMLVPVVSGTDAWEENAVASQQKLANYE